MNAIDGARAIARATAAAPAIAAMADQVEQGRCLPPALLDTLHQARLFRLLLPRAYGGDELAPAEYVRAMTLIAQQDASTAWCIGQASGCSMAAAYLEPGIAREIWADDPRAVLAWGSGPQGIARIVPGGYVVDGTWQFASGSRHATWLGGHCRIAKPDGALTQVERTMLFRPHHAVIEDTWHVMGLRGTGSDSYTVADLFIPDPYTVARDTDAERRQPGPLYKFTTTHLYASGFAAVALGIARGALNALIDLARAKTPSASARALRDNPVLQSQIAQAEAKLRAAQALLITTLEEAWDAAQTTASLPLDHRVSIRMATTYAIHQAKEVTATAYQEAGATAIFATNPFERRFRDAHSVSQQVQARMAHFEIVGQHLLGLPLSSRVV